MSTLPQGSAKKATTPRWISREHKSCSRGLMRLIGTVLKLWAFCKPETTLRLHTTLTTSFHKLIKTPTRWLSPPPKTMWRVMKLHLNSSQQVSINQRLTMRRWTWKGGMNCNKDSVSWFSLTSQGHRSRPKWLKPTIHPMYGKANISWTTEEDQYSLHPTAVLCPSEEAQILTHRWTSNSTSRWSPKTKLTRMTLSTSITPTLPVPSTTKTTSKFQNLKWWP